MYDEVKKATIYQSTIDMSKPSDARVCEINFIAEGALVLDVGCACGDLGIALKEHRKAQVWGFDYDLERVEIARSTNAYNEVHQVDLNKISRDDFSCFKKKFDYIVCGDVLEHLYDPKGVLLVLLEYLKEDGYFVISLPNVAHTSVKASLLVNDWTYTDIGLLDESHVRFFTYKTMAIFFAKLNGRIEECKFTLSQIQGHQPVNPYPKIPKVIKRFLFKDWHSFVCQYVMKIQIVQDETENLIAHNQAQLDINDKTAPSYIRGYRKRILDELKMPSARKITEGV
jgi:2-polyprenyl-3-methyl-5-hydroxy-6-metoxy-1,4-benzoquinol methylase